MKVLLIGFAIFWLAMGLKGLSIGQEAYGIGMIAIGCITILAAFNLKLTFRKLKSKEVK